MLSAFESPRRRALASVVTRALMLLLVLGSMACATLRGRADDALERGDYRRAVELYTQVYDRDPSDSRVKALLATAERGLLDQMLDRAEAARGGGDEREALHAALEAVQTKDRLHAGSLDPSRATRIDRAIEWAAATIRASVRSEASLGRALAARARRSAAADWLKRPELASVGPELDEAIAAAGAQTCTRATTSAAGQPFALELVAAYCKDVGGPMPPWAPRPLLVGGVVISGGVLGTPPAEQVELERAIAQAVERSVWFTATSSARAAVRVQGTVSAEFTSEPAELTRSWSERVPYEATETYQVPIEVPYVATETYSERVPYTAYEDRLESCDPPRSGLCNVSRPVTRYRDESRTREVQKFRTEYRTRTRQVTRYRDEPRIFRYSATKHEGRYQATFFVRADLGSGLRAIEARGAAEDSRAAYEHDTEFAPAGVHPERAMLPTAMRWRQLQRDRVRTELQRALDEGWENAFCHEGVSSIEEAARCAHARPSPVPEAVRARVAELFGDEPDRVLALPRPGEAVH